MNPSRAIQLNKTTSTMSPGDCCLYGSTCNWCPGGKEEYVTMDTCLSSRRCCPSSGCGLQMGDCCLWLSSCNGCPAGDEYIWMGSCSTSRRCSIVPTPDPTPGPTPSPTPEPTKGCADFCTSSGLDAANKKCKWNNCGGCPECVNSDVCSFWCKAEQCGLAKCGGCSMCSE